ncbi:mechanosensitive ion channel protein [Vulcanibacillus modesticaldus]|uniref:Mechanosensitive ion channel protein n=1 Tax=Vulcanibacillus modesticaldus TaxID=337097 RepID=A0A1D2YW73_9BACI|nr:mechanosensitive ion channel family protein [Vulcanibacillus modesticaldus]OEF99990.1 mechanosensitive ion channel protein [Vulcanibacillus modesticaldus]
MSDIFVYAQDLVNNWQTILINYVIAFVIFLFFLFLRKIFTRYLFNLFLKMTKKTKTDVDEIFLMAFQRPLRLFIVIFGLYLSLSYLPLSSGYDVISLKIFRSAIIILLAWGTANLSNSTQLWIEWLGKRYNLEIDKILIPFFSKVLKFIIIALTISIVAQEWNYDVNGLIAGLGLGGLAFALAAKDAVGNIFGGIVIITEKPFTLGDWIETPSVEGTVEDITFRSTKIRTFAQSLVTIPNSTLANEPITNWSKMGKRRITFYLGITYDTPREKIETVVKRIREMLETHPEIHQETIFVRFDKFSESSLDIFLYFFTKTTNWGEWLRVKEDCNLKILKILEGENVSIAFPSRSIYLETPIKQET